MLYLKRNMKMFITWHMILQNLRKQHFCGAKLHMGYCYDYSTVWFLQTSPKNIITFFILITYISMY